MERIDIPSGFFPLRQEQPQNKKVGGNKKAPKKSLFSILESESTTEGMSFQSSGGALSDEELGTMLDEIHRLGDAVKRETSLATIRDYRAAVSAFLHVVVERGLVMEENVSGRNILNRKKFSLIKVIDQKLERLALGVLQTQKDQLEILARVDEINGMLVDLLQ